MQINHPEIARHRQEISEWSREKLSTNFFRQAAWLLNHSTPLYIAKNMFREGARIT